MTSAEDKHHPIRKPTKQSEAANISNNAILHKLTLMFAHLSLPQIIPIPTQIRQLYQASTQAFHHHHETIILNPQH